MLWNSTICWLLQLSYRYLFRNKRKDTQVVFLVRLRFEVVIAHQHCLYLLFVGTTPLFIVISCEQGKRSIFIRLFVIKVWFDFFLRELGGQVHQLSFVHCFIVRNLVAWFFFSLFEWLYSHSIEIIVLLLGLIFLFRSIATLFLSNNVNVHFGVHFLLCLIRRHWPDKATSHQIHYI